MRTLALLAVATLALAGCNSEPDSRTKTLHLPKITVRHARVQLPPVQGRPAVAYFSIRARVLATLDGITSPSAEHIEMHETRMDGNVARMAAIQSLTLQPRETVEFEPGGKHAMLFGIAPQLRPGHKVPLTFIFRDVPPVTVEAEVDGTGES